MRARDSCAEPLLPHERWPTVGEVTVHYPSKAIDIGFLALLFGSVPFAVLAWVGTSFGATGVFTAGWADGAPFDFSDGFTLAVGAVVFAEWWASMYAMIRGRFILDGAD